MSSRAVICVATTPAYQKGMKRLADAVTHCELLCVSVLPSDWPAHAEKPYAFKPYALQAATLLGADTLLWCDASMLPVQDMTPLWERIERDGYWFSKCGWTNYEWTADSAYPDLFDWKLGVAVGMSDWQQLAQLREVNKDIPHVVATCFGLSMKHEIGRKFLAQYYRLASETKAFCGPWINTAWSEAPPRSKLPDSAPACGPKDVRGHRHDQTAASVIAWRLGMKLTDPPEIFAYGKAGEQHDPRTIMIADGGY